MVVDSSAIIAILLDEPENAAFSLKLSLSPSKVISAVSFVECGMVIIGRFGDAGKRDLDRLTTLSGIKVVPVSERQAEIAIAAFRRYGKGRHPAGLNCGDCFAYALAKETGQPLLFKGDDFPQTDIPLAPY